MESLASHHCLRESPIRGDTLAAESPFKQLCKLRQERPDIGSRANGSPLQLLQFSIQHPEKPVGILSKQFIVRHDDKRLALGAVQLPEQIVQLPARR